MLNCDASNVTGIIDRLFSHAYIERQEKPTDRRVKMISLTPKGEKLRQEIIKEALADKPETFDHLSGQQQDQLRDLLKRALKASE
jgi:DNA-binding MarR family transcriptional regulator